MYNKLLRSSCNFVYLNFFVIQQMIYTRYSSSGGWGCFLLGALGVIALFYVLRAVFNALYIVSPVLIIAAILLNWRAVWDTFREMWALLLERPLSGLLIMALASVLYPVTALYLLLRALGYWRMAHTFEETREVPKEALQGEYIEFEEIETHTQRSGPIVEDAEMEPLPPPDDLPPEDRDRT